MTLRVELLEKYEIDATQLDDGSHKVHCPKCQPPHNLKDTPLSLEIDYEKILFFCHHCGDSGGVFADQAKRVKRPKPEKKQVSAESLGWSQFLKGRGISEQTQKALDVFEKDGWVHFPYNLQAGQADNVKSRNISDKQFRQSKDPVKSLYNYQRVKDSDTVVFVEGEMDALSIFESGIQAVTTLPDGAPSQAAFKENDKRFACLATHPIAAKKVILFCDNDSAGKNLRRELLHRYGKERCWRVRPPEGCKDANDVLLKLGKEKLKQLVDSAKPYPVDGLYQVRNYYDDVIDLFNGNYDRPVTVGYDSLDALYKVQRGTFHTWTGIPNHGKSTFLDQCLIQLARKNDWKFALFSPEHSTKMHVRRLLQMVVGKAFDHGVVGRMTEAEAIEGMAWIQDHFYFIETREHIPTVDKILEITKATVEKFGINGLVIDPYNEVNASRRGNSREDEHIRDFISKCKRFCKIHDIVIWVVAHPTKQPKENGTYQAPTAYDISGAAHWHNQSDAVVVVHRDFDANSIQVITRKIREQGLYGRIGECTFFYNDETKLFEEPVIGSYRSWAQN